MSRLMDRLLKFEGLERFGSKWTYRRLGKRCPNAGEYFMSGAIPEAFKARQNLTTEYEVVAPLVEHLPRKVWLPV